MVKCFKRFACLECLEVGPNVLLVGVTRIFRIKIFSSWALEISSKQTSFKLIPSDIAQRSTHCLNETEDLQTSNMCQLDTYAQPLQYVCGTDAHCTNCVTESSIKIGDFTCRYELVGRKSNLHFPVR